MYVKLNAKPITGTPYGKFEQISQNLIPLQHRFDMWPSLGQSQAYPSTHSLHKSHKPTVLGWEGPSLRLVETMCVVGICAEAMGAGGGLCWNLRCGDMARLLQRPSPSDDWNNMYIDLRSMATVKVLYLSSLLPIRGGGQKLKFAQNMMGRFLAHPFIIRCAIAIKS